MLLADEARKLVLKAAKTATTVSQVLIAACPCRASLRINIQINGRTLFAVCGTGLVGCAISHNDIDHVIIRVCIFFHRRFP